MSFHYHDAAVGDVIELTIALQCGGSDAFSGVSGNPLAGALVHEAIRHGGAGNLCETDELMGAEAYVMKNVKDLATGGGEHLRRQRRWVFEPVMDGEAKAGRGGFFDGEQSAFP